MSTPIQLQPQSRWQTTNIYQNMCPSPVTNVSCELENLTKVEEIIFKDKVFQTRDGRILYSVHQEMEHGSPLNLYLRDGYKRDTVWLHVVSDERCGHEPYLQIAALPMQPLGNVKIDSVTGNLIICVQNTSTFIASLPMFLQTQRSTSIEILSMSGCHQVAKITGERVEQSAQVLFQLSSALDSRAKTVILGAFLYLNFHLHEILKVGNSPTNFHNAWIVDCVDWENRTGLSSQPCEKQVVAEVNSASAEGDCCSKCCAKCRNCMCCCGDCLCCCAECCGCCLCCLTCMSCVL